MLLSIFDIQLNDRIEKEQSLECGDMHIWTVKTLKLPRAPDATGLCNSHQSTSLHWQIWLEKLGPRKTVDPHLFKELQLKCNTRCTRRTRLSGLSSLANQGLHPWKKAFETCEFLGQFASNSPKVTYRTHTVSFFAFVHSEKWASVRFMESLLAFWGVAKI